MAGGWRRAALGVFLEFRLIPVLLWSFTSVGIGTALASFETGRLDLAWLSVAMGLALLIQGWVTHAVNEVYDARSGTDGHAAPRALSGGSKVVQMELLSERELWGLFAASSVGVLLLAVPVALLRPPWLLLLVGSGYSLGVAYTLPPLSTAYRPFLGEWLGGFPGVVLATLGAYAIQAGTISGPAVVAAVAHAAACTSMLVMHHYLDANADAAATPRKRTTVLALGSEGARTYATAVAAAGALAYLAVGVLVHPSFFVGAGLTAVAALLHARVHPRDLRSVTRAELRVIQLGIAAGLVPAAVLAPSLAVLLPLAAIGYLAHLAVVAPPRGLARAWRPSGDARSGAHLGKAK